MDYKLNLDNPRTFNEKLQWIKLNDHNPLYTELVDKYRVKQYVTEKVGSEYVIPLLGQWDSVDKIEWEKLPNQFVIKCSHDSGSTVLCKDKSALDIDTAKKKLESSLKRNYYWESREWPYKNVKPRIFAEAYMEDEFGELRDYKWFCFDGEPKAMFVASDRQKNDEETKFDFYDENFNHLPITNGHPNSSTFIEKPKGFDIMKELASKLSKGLPEVRMDFYDVNGKVYFGEFTFFHWGGLMPFEPREWDLKFGDWIKLPNNH
ncbi:MAG: glycosyl transferase [Prevotella sp.]|nr:glycosyl transferase [Prevotella sp.]